MTVEKEYPTTSTKTSTELSDVASGILQSFIPLKGFCKHLNGIHGYAKEPNQQVIVDHYCGHLTEDLCQ